MRLSASILYDYLKRDYNAALYGKVSGQITLLPPEFITGSTAQLLAGHVYLATVEHLPRRAAVEREAVLICIGEGQRLSYYKEHAAVIVIQQKADLFAVCNSLQEINALFQNWQNQLLELFTGQLSIQKALDCSYPIFQCPLFLLDESFRYVASVQSDGGSQLVQPSDSLDSEDFLTFLKEQEPLMDRKGAFLLSLGKGSFLCVNLFDAQDDYIGCLFIDRSGHERAEYQDALAEYLAHILEKIAELSPSLLRNRRSSLVEIIQLVINELPLSQNQKMMLLSANQNGPYVFVSVHYFQRFSILPINYICSVFEAKLPGSLFFAQNDLIMGIAPAAAFDKQSADLSLKPDFVSYVKDIELRVGLSNEFADLNLLRDYFFQAESAIANGQLYSPGQSLYRFSEFALAELISNAMGEFHVDAYFPNGFRSLLDHDQEGGISYLETLDVFLEENMSFAQAARRLFIHRSTLVERLDRIRQELSLNLDDPDQRLQLQIILKAMKLEKELQK